MKELKTEYFKDTVIESESYYDYFVQLVRSEQRKIKLSVDYSKFDVNTPFTEYFKTFDCLYVEDGWQIGCYYFHSSTAGNPVIYIQKADEDINDLLSRIDNKGFMYDHRIFEYCETVKTTDHLKINDFTKGLFQLLILDIIGANFALYWHAGYGRVQIICSKRDLDKLLFDHDVDADKRSEIKKLNELPSIEETNEAITFKLLMFNAWSGLKEKTYSIKKEFPHKISMVSEKLLVEYHCEIMF